MEVEGRTAVVVGGTGDIGHATASRFVKGGASVIITGRRRERADAKAASLGQAARGIVADPADETQLRTAFDEIGSFDYLLVTLGTQAVTMPFAEMTEDHLKQAINDKFLQYTRSLRAALGKVSESVTWLTAAAARTALPGMSNYAAPNGALHSMLGPLAIELSPVRINGVAAGLTRTAFWDALGLPSEAQEQMFASAQRSIPLGHVAQPDEIAQAMYFVATNTYTTGTVLDTCGGLQLGQMFRGPEPSSFGSAGQRAGSG